jgi:hypothetical protein
MADVHAYLAAAYERAAPTYKRAGVAITGRSGSGSRSRSLGPGGRVPDDARRWESDLNPAQGRARLRRWRSATRSAARERG